MNKENAPCGGLTFFCLLFLCQDKKRRKNDKKSALNFHLPNDSKKPIPAKSTLPRPPTDKENAPCGGLTFFCLLFLCQDKKRRKRQKKNVPNFHLPHDSEKPIPTKVTIPRVSSQAILIKYSNPRPSGIPVLGRFPNPNASA